MLLAILLVAAAIAYGLRLSFPATPQPAAPAYLAFPADAPAPKPQDYVAAQKGFQYLVSYSDSGFHPMALSVKKGEAIRFTNNSDTSLRLSLSNTRIASFGHAEYFEYAFTKTGSFTFSDGMNVVVIDVE